MVEMSEEDDLGGERMMTSFGIFLIGRQARFELVPGFDLNFEGVDFGLHHLGSGVEEL
jgi:hypothetical protein